MSLFKLSLAAFGFMSLTALYDGAQAYDYSSGASYNAGYGMSAGQENASANPSLRDANGNLTIVNGHFASSTFASQTNGAGYAQQQVSGVGTPSAGTTMSGTASAIGNSLNVVTNGSFNTVIVDSTQTNNGDLTASVILNGQ